MTSDLTPIGLPAPAQSQINFFYPSMQMMPVVNLDHAPTQNDWNYPLFTIARNNNRNAVLPDQYGDAWLLVKFTPASGNTHTLATWVKIVAGTSGDVEAFAVDTSTPPGTNPVLPTASVITVTGGQVAPATIGAKVIRTNSTAASEYAIEIQQTSVAAAKDTTLNGVAHFNSAEFTNDEGFISLVGGGVPIEGLVPDAHTAPGTSPVVPNGSGNITLEGGATFATGTQANPIRTNSLAANKMDFQIQLAGSNAGASTANNFGVAQFDSNQFTVTSGFVQLAGGTTAAIEKVNVQTGTSPIVPSSGAITINGATVAAGTNPVRTDGTDANTMAVEVQISQAIAATDATKIGLSNFNSSQFSVDANGFVSLNAAFSTINIQIFTSSGTYTPSAGMKYCIIECVGSGGGGGGASATGPSDVSAGSGGGGGGYSRQFASAATIGVSQTVTVATGGAGGIGAADGTAGGTSSFGTICSGTGGGQGVYAGVGAIVAFNGGGGGTGGGAGAIHATGGGGGACFGVFGGTGSGVMGGFGGSSAYAGNNTARAGGTPTNSNGNDGHVYGSGGGGGVNTESQAAVNGGNGANGLVIVTEFIL